MIAYDRDKTAEVRAAEFARSAFAASETVPFSFTYRKKDSREFLKDWAFEKTGEGVRYTSPDGLCA